MIEEFLFMRVMNQPFDRPAYRPSNPLSIVLSYNGKPHATRPKVATLGYSCRDKSWNQYRVAMDFELIKISMFW